MTPKKPNNPFYIALLPVGVLFVITACAFGVMMVQDLSPQQGQRAGTNRLMADHGLAILAVELLVLGALTFAAIYTDDYWTRRFERRFGGDDHGGSERPAGD
jgi:hypothetical protein